MLLMRRELMTPLILNYRMQMSSMFCLKFFSLLQPSLWELEVSHLLMICLLKPGTQSLVVNFLAHWLLVVTMDTPLSGWDGTGKSIALCWLITDFPTEQNGLMDDCSCRFSLSTLPAHHRCTDHTTEAVPVSGPHFLLSRRGSGYPTMSKTTNRLGHTPDLAFKWLSLFSLHRPPSCPLDGAVNSCL